MRRKNIAVLGIALGLGLTLSACDLRIGAWKERETLNYDVTDKVAALVVRAGIGDVTVNGSDASGIQVAETVEWTGDKPHDGHKVNGDTLTLAYDCNNCAIHYRVDVPRGLDVKVESGTGDITIRSLTGPVRLTTGIGDVDTSGLGGKQVSAETGTGDVKLKFASAPDRVDVETGTGDATMWIPAESYKLTVDTGLGDKEIGIVSDPSASRSITITTGIGDIKVLKP
ncbi:DUF4097 family beta strand repeat protein [Microtetraspora sp. AC03309]|uniref:DUF4097 family beta strand repeat-containing protein n=1 Tax=Microtetraspora sp. AC03309 TaxID=2779376 RepID=UPI001E65431F|nr:DUF4097 family beta strand repeat-containing protein [Microtetraspora sp. AC03309]MCC5575201.1 DUF4097 family beta strand repeat protein [Microtetraspora sp. AC03309]